MRIDVSNGVGGRVEPLFLIQRDEDVHTECREGVEAVAFRKTG